MDTLSNVRILKCYDECCWRNKKDVANIKSKLYDKLYRKLRMKKEDVYTCLVNYQPLVVIKR